MFYFFRTFAPIFYFKLCSFVNGGRKNVSCPREQDTLATPLNALLNVNHNSLTNYLRITIYK